MTLVPRPSRRSMRVPVEPSTVDELVVIVGVDLTAEQAAAALWWLYTHHGVELDLDEK